MHGIYTPVSAAAFLNTVAAQSTPPEPKEPPANTPKTSREVAVEAQLARLRDVTAWAERNKGACLDCRFAFDHRCLNPAVSRPSIHPASGSISYDAPYYTEERQEEYDTSGYVRRWEGPTLCGPHGLLFEPRTYRQFLTRWALAGLHLLWIGPSAFFATMVLWWIAHGAPVAQ